MLGSFPTPARYTHTRTQTHAHVEVELGTPLEKVCLRAKPPPCACCARCLRLFPYAHTHTKHTQQVEVELGTPLEKVFEGEASPLRVLGVVREEGFKLGDRAAHVYSEADRVYAFRDAAEVRSLVHWRLVPAACTLLLAALIKSCHACA